MFLPYVYAIYALVSIVLTIWLARTLATNGRAFLDDVFPESPQLAAAVNKLLVVGFYLVNFGYACLLLTGGYAPTLQNGIEALAGKLGALLLSLAAMHFVNLFIFHRIRRRARRSAEPPPVRAHGALPTHGFAAVPHAQTTSAAV